MPALLNHIILFLLMAYPDSNEFDAFLYTVCAHF